MAAAAVLPILSTMFESIESLMCRVQGSGFRELMVYGSGFGAAFASNWRRSVCVYHRGCRYRGRRGLALRRKGVSINEDDAKGCVYQRG
ncbi:hypothetical protein T484DRAFT_2931146 [Baffinella frigidus]|nr:hypothetical protein T484DRAFT_2931146 [Cryptophyta sp. CCMP2293]